MNRFVTALLVIVVSVGVTEAVLRHFFGNLAISQLFQFHPGDGRCVALKPNATVQYTGHWLRTAPVTQEVNSLGFRGPVVQKERSIPSLRIAALGDSFTYGVGVVEHDTFTARMEDLLHAAFPRRVDVLNFGVPGLNLEDVRQQYESFARQWKPDLVLYFMFSNDLDRPFCDTMWGRMATPEGFRSLANKFVLLRLAYVLFSGTDNEPKSRDGLALRQQLIKGLRKFKQRTDADGASLRLVVLGDPVPFSERTGEREDLKNMGLPVLDLEYLVQDPQNRLPRDTHFSPRGHRLAAEAVTNWLASSWKTERSWAARPNVE